MVKHHNGEDNSSLWIRFEQEESLTAQQGALFKQYDHLLQTWNQKFNITAITSTEQVIAYHFQDSLRVADIIAMPPINHCADVGSGGGFPGIPLAIKYPHLAVTLIEVTIKKIDFLKMVIAQLGLESRVTVCERDWRTFLRTMQEPIELFCARASLKPDELIRLFKPGCYYKNAQLVYWASADWHPSDLVAPYVVQEYAYRIRHKKRRLVLFQNKKKESS